MKISPQERVFRDVKRVELGDKRLTRRTLTIVDRLIKNPDTSFPEAMGTGAEIEGFYRLIKNERVDLQSLIRPHIETTHKLMTEQPLCLIVHDSSECYFANAPQGNTIGYLGKRSGFLLHAALAISADNRHAPLGVLGLMPIRRSRPQSNRKARQKYRLQNPNCAKESNRWGALISSIEKEASSPLIHIMDREGDIYSLLCQLSAKSRRFVVRLRQNRRLADGENTILEAMDGTSFMGEREVPLSKRNNEHLPRNKKSFPSRKRRMANLSIKTKKVTLRRPQRALSRLPTTLEVTVVQVTEVNVPQGEAPVSWTLLTSEKVATAAEAFKVVDHYRGRWRIEEYFKALKTGCEFEKRQLETLEAVLNVLGMMAPIAWQMLALRTLAQDAPESPAEELLEKEYLSILLKQKRVPPNPTTYETLIAIAELGGYIKGRKEPPGWLTLTRGFEKLLAYAVGWRLAMQNL